MVAVGSLLLGASNARADCGGPSSVEEAYSQADLVFIGRAVNLEPTAGGAIVQFDVLESWKQSVRTVRLFANDSPCHEWYFAGTDYLVFALKDERGWRSRCQAGGEATGVFRQLVALRDKPRQSEKWRVPAWGALFAALSGWALRRRRLGRSLAWLAAALAVTSGVVRLASPPGSPYEARALPPLARHAPAARQLADLPIDFVSFWAVFSSDGRRLWATGFSRGRPRRVRGRVQTTGVELEAVPQAQPHRALA